MGVLKELDELQIGAVQTSAYPGATGNSAWDGNKVGKVTVDGIKINNGKPKKDKLRECGNAIPVDVTVAPSEDGLVLAGALICEVDDVLVNTFGGTLSADGWTPPKQINPIYGGFLAKTKTTGLAISVPNGMLTANFAGQLAESGSVQIEFEIECLDAGDTLAAYKFLRASS